MQEAYDLFVFQSSDYEVQPIQYKHDVRKGWRLILGKREVITAWRLKGKMAFNVRWKPGGWHGTIQATTKVWVTNDPV